VVTEIVIGLAVLALLIYRQLRTRPVNASGLRIVAVIGVIGLVETYQFLQQHHAGAVTYAALLGSLALAVHLGYDALVAGPGRDNVGAATIVLYLAVSLAIQRLIVRLRAQRLPSGPIQDSGLLSTLRP
jgi:hypothetical protein